MSGNTLYQHTLPMCPFIAIHHSYAITINPHHQPKHEPVTISLPALFTVGPYQRSTFIAIVAPPASNPLPAATSLSSTLQPEEPGILVFEDWSMEVIVTLMILHMAEAVAEPSIGHSPLQAVNCRDITILKL